MGNMALVHKIIYKKDLDYPTYKKIIKRYSKEDIEAVFHKVELALKENPLEEG